MTVTVHIYPNERLILDISDGTAKPLVNNNQQLSHEEFEAALQRLADLSMKFDGPDAQPLSDYAMSRESIYEDHPKL